MAMTKSVAKAVPRFPKPNGTNSANGKTARAIAAGLGLILF
jgi:hypothetical protein